MTLPPASIYQSLGVLSTVLREKPAAQIVILKCTFLQGSYSLQITCLKEDGTNLKTDFDIFKRFEDTLHALRPTNHEAALSIEISLDQDGL